jgi:hypothetical protein
MGVDTCPRTTKSTLSSCCRVVGGKGGGDLYAERKSGVQAEGFKVNGRRRYSLEESDRTNIFSGLIR